MVFALGFFHHNAEKERMVKKILIALGKSGVKRLHHLGDGLAIEFLQKVVLATSDEHGMTDRPATLSH